LNLKSKWSNTLIGSIFLNELRIFKLYDRLCTLKLVVPKLHAVMFKCGPVHTLL